MNGAHDLGGMHGFGLIDVVSGEKLFHAEWERRVFALTLACGFHGKWNIDQSRFARERMGPGEYLQSSYYEHWLHGLETLLSERGMYENLGDLTAIAAARVPEILAAGGPADCAVESEPAYAVGDSVATKHNHPDGHTRLPLYARGKCGVINSYHGAHVYPDENSRIPANRRGAHLYSVRFEAGELWGEQGESRGAIFVDVFEPYIKGKV